MDIANFHGLMPIRMAEAGDGGGGDGGTAVATVDTGTDLVPSGGDGSLDSGDGTADLTTTQDGAVTPRRERGDGKAQSELATKALAVFKEHPELSPWKNSALQAIQFRKTFRAMFPGVSPVAAVKSLQNDMRGLAGRYYNTPDPNDPQHRTGIQQIKDKLAEMDDIDLLYYSGDPRILDGMTGDEEGKAAFLKLRPHINARFRQIAPNASFAEAARQTLTSLKSDYLYDDKGQLTNEQAEIDVRLRRMFKALYTPDGKQLKETPDLSTVAEELNAMWAYFTGLQRLAKLEPEVFAPDTKAASHIDEREQRLNQREQESKDREWNKDRTDIANQISGRLWRQLTKGHEISAQDLTDTQSLYHVRYDQMVTRHVPDADAKREAFFRANDRDGYLAFEKYLMDTYGVPALKTEVSKLLARIGTKAKPGAAPARIAKPGTSPAAATPTGYTKLSQKPADVDIDYTVRTIDDIKAKRAVLRKGNSLGKPAGFKVCW